jgi:uncharacterized protein (DUF302 family)
MNARKLFRFTSVLVLLSILGCSAGKVMIHERRSPLDFDATVATIKQNAHAQGWEVPRDFDFQKALTARGQPDPGRITVLKLCSPEFATRMFVDDESKFVSVMAPCSISVYEKSDGRTYISTMNMKLMSRLMGPTIGPVLGDIAVDDEAILAFTD